MSTSQSFSNPSPTSSHTSPSALPSLQTSHTPESQSPRDRTALKRKRGITQEEDFALTTHAPAQLSSPPPEHCYTSSAAKKEGQVKEQGSKTPLGRLSPQHPVTWSGRGRSPYKVPTTAVLDNIRNNTRQLEQLDRQLVAYQQQQRVLIREKRLKLSTQSTDEDMASEDPIDYEPGGGEKPAVEQVNLDWMRPESQPGYRSGSLVRATSPSKAKARMREGQPPIIDIPFDDIPGDLADKIKSLIKDLITDLGQKSIPFIYKNKVQKPDDLFRINDSWFKVAAEASDHKVFKLVSTVNRDAKECDDELKDENAWCMKTVEPLLAWDLASCGEDGLARRFSRVESIQTQSIDQSFLQNFKISTVPSNRTRTGKAKRDKSTDDAGDKAIKALNKKADFALAIERHHPKALKHYNSIIRRGEERPSLSQMTDACTSKLVLYLGVEVKKRGGSETEAEAQLYIWLAAGITNLRTLRWDAAKAEKLLRPSDEPSMPLIGLTVVGYTWSLYVAYGEGHDQENGPIYIIGPIVVSDASSKLLCYYKVVELVQRVKYWAEDVFWPWFRSQILDPLAKRET